MVHSPDATQGRRVASVIIPAYNEERAIGRLLDQLLDGGVSNEFEIVVLCNGCTDRTAQVARGYEPSVKVIELPEPSKRAALKHGDIVASVFPRLYVDSDVEIGAADVRSLAAALEGAVLVAAPERVIPRTRVGMWVRAYYDVWERLPQVRTAPFGRGVVALSDAGHQRIRTLPAVMADDLAMTATFSPCERVIISDAKVVIWPPRTLRDLIRRRIRVHTGNTQFDMMTRRSMEIRTSIGDLIQLVRVKPAMAPRVAIFAGVAVISRLSARRRIRSGDFETWERDQSSRLSA